MARHRVPGGAERPKDARAVPVELLDHQADVWASTAAFQRWCREHLGAELAFIPLADAGPYHRFTAAAERWASANGFDLPGRYGGTDWERLGEMGMQRPRRRQVTRRHSADNEVA